MAGYEVGDKVVYAPHGAGIVVSKERRGDDFGEYLSIRIAHSKMTLMVPADAAVDKGVRPIIGAKAVATLLRELGEAGEELPENQQLRARETADKTRGGGVQALASVLRDYTTRARGGKKLSPVEQKALDSAKLALASEIALARDVDLDAATAQIEQALGDDE